MAYSENDKTAQHTYLTNRGYKIASDGSGYVNGNGNTVKPATSSGDSFKVGGVKYTNFSSLKKGRRV